MQAISQWDVQRDQDNAALLDFLQSFDQGGTDVSYAAERVTSFWRQRGPIDEHIERCTEGWSLARMSPVERNVMRVALSELYDAAVPPKVAVNEALEIADEFGGKDSVRFVNGVLDAVLRSLDV